MKASCERMDYIVEYLSTYENKIKAANKLGLFDAAKMFELFAQNVSALWFGQPFTNLNAEVSNYPYVDLIAEDKTVFVQVSTTQDIAQKVKI
ncbi:MAG: SMEK domain-containing protein [Oscillospiraceae bacterium]|nr:SMEK domain-containing protein [Oscillospiraceae bacterium]